MQQKPTNVVGFFVCTFIDWGKETGSHIEIWMPGAVTRLRSLASPKVHRLFMYI